MLNRIVDAVTTLIGDHGVPAVFFLMVLESACLPVPSEVIMLFAGYLVSIDKMSLAAAVTAGVAGNIVGSWIAWGVGMTGGRVLSSATAAGCISRRPGWTPPTACSSSTASASC